MIHREQSGGLNAPRCYAGILQPEQRTKSSGEDPSLAIRKAAGIFHFPEFEFQIQKVFSMIQYA